MSPDLFFVVVIFERRDGLDMGSKGTQLLLITFYTPLWYLYNERFVVKAILKYVHDIHIIFKRLFYFMYVFCFHVDMCTV